MAIRYQKTDAGRDEIRARAHDLSRPARTLLLIIDASKTGDEWLAMVNGVVAADLARLLEAGLIAVAGGSAPAAAAPSAAPAAPKGPNLQEALQYFTYRELYDRLTAEARPRFGLIKGYKWVLDIEKCRDVDEIRALTYRFIEEIRGVQGDKAARDFCRELGAES